jgi:hypothetical protein
MERKGLEIGAVVEANGFQVLRSAYIQDLHVERAGGDVRFECFAKPAEMPAIGSISTQLVFGLLPNGG